jgi:hypothetical protein
MAAAKFEHSARLSQLGLVLRAIPRLVLGR